ncbi:MAG: single-stranded-DNA-specific exonuclease RecJ [Parcubacteria group bacterium]|jgi:single-stranded-DNA-specific exonuclease
MTWNLKAKVSLPPTLKSLSLNTVTLELLLQRGFLKKEKIQKFLNTDFGNLHSPCLLSGVKEAVTRIIQARNKKEKIVIFGDYDADGITSTAILKEVLGEIGIEVYSYIPDRNKEGYGLNKKALDFIAAEYRPKLLITVDCGISNSEEIGYAQKKGIEVIVTDHHSIPKILPKNIILINPKLPDQKYPFRELAGVGVVYKLSQALYQEILPAKVEQLKWFLDLVAIGTIADCVPLVDENRVFAKFGLIVLQKTKRLGVQEIIKTARLNINEQNPPNAENIAFQIGPRFNAAGRMDHADIALNLLTEKDPVKARLAALEIESKNSERQKVTQHVYEEVKKTLAPREDHKLIIRKGEHWPLGILGVVAGKIADEYCCPTFILRETGDLLEGSGRSIEAFDLIKNVSQLDQHLEKFGGHAQAMGIKVKKNKLALFENGLLSLIEKKYTPEKWGKAISADIEIDPNNLDWDIISEIKKFEPFGEGNREPIFLSHNLSIQEMKIVGNGQKHLKLKLGTTENGAKSFEAIFFKGVASAKDVKVGDSVSALYNLRSSEWNGNHRIEMNIIDLEKSK